MELKEIQELVKKQLSENKYCNAIGYVTREELLTLYNLATCLVFPSRYEGFGLPVLEAMACGCPLLIADSPTSAAKQFVQDNGYTFAIDDPQDLADKIYTLYTHPEICELMSKVSSKQALQFTFEQSVKHMETFLQSFIHTQEKTTWNE